MVRVGTAYISGDSGLKMLRQKEDNPYAETLRLLPTARDGTPCLAQELNPQQVTVYDATPFVNCEWPGTYSGAHSDVYDTEMGHFLGEIIHASGNMAPSCPLEDK